MSAYIHAIHIISRTYINKEYAKCCLKFNTAYEIILLYVQHVLNDLICFEIWQTPYVNVRDYA